MKHARYYWLLLAESNLTRRNFASIRRRIVALPSPAGKASRRSEQISVTKEAGEGKVSQESVGKTAVSRFGIPDGGSTRTLPWSLAASSLKTRLDLHFEAVRFMLPVSRKSKWKSRITFHRIPHGVYAILVSRRVFLRLSDRQKRRLRCGLDIGRDSHNP